MTRRRRRFAWALAALCAVVCALLVAGAVSVYREGAALRAAGDASAWIFTRERAARRLAPAGALGLAALVMGVAGALLGVRGETLGGDGGPVRPAPAPSGRGARAARIALLLLALGMIAAGVFNGGARDVLAKAVNICTECVGLG